MENIFSESSQSTYTTSSSSAEGVAACTLDVDTNPCLILKVQFTYNIYHTWLIILENIIIFITIESLIYGDLQ